MKTIKAIEADKLAKREECRDLVTAVRKHFTQDQIVMIIKLLSLELESNEAMRSIHEALASLECSSRLVLNVEQEAEAQGLIQKEEELWADLYTTSDTQITLTKKNLSARTTVFRRGWFF